MKGELWVDGITSSCNGPLKYNVTCNIHVIFYLRRNNPLEPTGYLLPWKEFGVYLWACWGRISFYHGKGGMWRSEWFEYLSTLRAGTVTDSLFGWAPESDYRDSGGLGSISGWSVSRSIKLVCMECKNN